MTCSLTDGPVECWCCQELWIFWEIRTESRMISWFRRLSLTDKISKFVDLFTRVRSTAYRNVSFACQCHHALWQLSEESGPFGHIWDVLSQMERYAIHNYHFHLEHQSISLWRGINTQLFAASLCHCKQLWLKAAGMQAWNLIAMSYNAQAFSSSTSIDAVTCSHILTFVCYVAEPSLDLNSTLWPTAISYVDLHMTSRRTAMNTVMPRNWQSSWLYLSLQYK